MKTLKKDPKNRGKSGNELRKLATLKLTGHKLKESIEEAKLPISDDMFKSLKKGDKIKIGFDSSIKKGNENTYVVVSKTKSAKYNLEKIKLKNVANPVAQASFLYNRQGKVTMSQGDMAVTMNTAVKESMQFDEKRDAGKSATGYDIYHKTYSAAMQHAYAHAKKKHGVTVSSDEIDSKVASGPSKPSSGKTVSHVLGTDKKKKLHVQVYNTGKSYELNMYVESVEEASILKTVHKNVTNKKSAEKDRKKAVKTFKNIRKGKYPGVKFAEETLDEADILSKKPHPKGGHILKIRTASGQVVTRHLNKGKVKTLAVHKEDLDEDDASGLSVKKGHKLPVSKGAGLTKKGVAAYRRKNPGSELQTAVTTKPSKLDPDSKAAKRRKSFCARSRGWTGERGKAARRRWNC
jgi:hypothetical protein